MNDDDGAGFAELFGVPSGGCWEAPGRVNLIGEHTDYSGGRVLPLAISTVTRVEARARRDDLIRVASMQESAVVVEARLEDLLPGSVHGWSAYPLGVAWALRACGLDCGADLLIDGQVPLGAGLSSSAALECAVALAFNDLFSLGLDRMSLARTARHAENDFVGVPCGLLDQMASLLASRNHALLIDLATLDWRPVPFDPRAQGLHLLVVSPAQRHRLGESPYAERRAQCRQAEGELGIDHLGSLGEDDLPVALTPLSSDTLRRRVRHVITENARVTRCAELLDLGRLEEIGEILTAGHRSLAEDYEVSTPGVDGLVTAALSSGALGARMVGGGFGGAIIVLVPEDASEALCSALGTFAEGEGLGPVAIFEAVASDGAHGSVDAER